MRLHQTKEDTLKRGIIIDATVPLAQVFDEIICLSDAKTSLQISFQGRFLSNMDRILYRRHLPN